jgi:hypothetical protein
LLADAGLLLPPSARGLRALAPLLPERERLLAVYREALARGAMSGSDIEAMRWPTGHSGRPYAEERSRPDGWRDVVEAARKRQGTALRIPASIEAAGAQLTGLGVEALALLAAQADVAVECLRPQTRAATWQDCAREFGALFRVEETARGLWRDAAGSKWTPCLDFWPAVDAAGWLDVRSFVRDALGEADDLGWAVGRAAEVLAQLPEAS